MLNHRQFKIFTIYTRRLDSKVIVVCSYEVCLYIRGHAYVFIVDVVCKWQVETSDIETTRKFEREASNFSTISQSTLNKKATSIF